MLLEFSTAFLDAWLEDESDEVLGHWTRVKQIAERAAELETALRHIQCEIGCTNEAHDIIAAVIGTPQNPVGVAAHPAVRGGISE